jgi:DivIVA domain-containing protein
MDPDQIEQTHFLVALRGYARDEVDSFLKDVAGEVRGLRRQLATASAELDARQAELKVRTAELEAKSSELAQLAARPQPVQAPAEVIHPQPTDRAQAIRAIGDETERILLAAEDAAIQIRERAMKDSAELVTDARLQAERTIREIDERKNEAAADLAKIESTRGMMASQLEDIRRRIDETVARLRTPVDPLPPPQSTRIGRSAPGRQPEGLPDRMGRSPALGTVSRGIGPQAQSRGSAAAPRASAEAARTPSGAILPATPEQVAPQKVTLRSVLAPVETIAPPTSASEAPPAPAWDPRAPEAPAAPPDSAPGPPDSAPAPPDSDPATKAGSALEIGHQQFEVEEPEALDEQAEQDLEDPGVSEALGGSAGQPARDESEPHTPGLPTISEDFIGQLLLEIRRQPAQGTQSEEPEEQGEQPWEAKVAELPVDRDMLARRTAALGELPAQALRRIKRLLQEDQNDLLDRLRTQRGRGTVDDNLAPVQEQFARFQSALSDVLAQAFARGREVGGATDAGEAAKAVSNLVARQIFKPLRSEISRTVSEGLDAGDTPNSIAERVGDVYRVWKGVRTELLGEGMAYAAFHQGLADAWKGIDGAKKRWLVAEEADCPNDLCRTNAGAGAIDIQAVFPSGHLTPPAHGGCACALDGPGA